MSEKNYIELFTDNRGLIDRGGSPVLNALRDRAFQSFRTYGFPTRRVEEYLHTDVSEWFEPDWGMNLARVNIPVDTAEAFRCNVPNMSTQLFFLAGDRFIRRDGPTSLPDGVIAGSLKDVSETDGELVAAHLGRLADIDRPGIAALNTMFLQDGFVVYVPDGVVIEKPVQLVSLMQPAVSMLAMRRILVILGRGAGLRLLMCDHSSAGKECMSACVTECFVGSGASLELYDLEETASTNTRVCEYYVSQEQDSNVHADLITLHNGRTRNTFTSVFKGRGASLELNGIAISDNTQHIDNYTFVDHQASDCTSHELFKCMLDAEATGSFAGKVLVRPGAQRTVSTQTNRNICLTGSAHMFTQPQLEIYADDVKCSHGATVGQLDEKALFYMRQRGIGLKEARMLLMLAFLSEVLDRISLDPLRSRLTGLVELRLRHGQSKCDGCNVCK